MSDNAEIARLERRLAVLGQVVVEYGRYNEMYQKAQEYVATEDDKRTYAAFAEAHRRSQPTLKTAKSKTKKASDRLFGG